MKMSSSEFKRLMETNLNVQLIIAGMAGLVDEGRSPHEVFDVLEAAKSNTFHALSNLNEEDE